MNMRVYMLNPPYLPHFGRGMRWQDTGRGGTLYYPIWLSYATGVVEQEYETKLADAPAWNWSVNDVVRDVVDFSPELIVLDSSFPSLDNDLKVAEKLKEAVGSKIALVGPPASQFPDRILSSKGIDIVARYEYDFTLKEIAESIAKSDNFAKIEGVSFKENNNIINTADRPFTSSQDLDKIPFVSKVYKKHLNIDRKSVV